MKVALPEALWPCTLFIPLLVWMARVRCLQLAEGYLRFVFRFVTLGLPNEAKVAWRNEAYYDIVQFISSDLKRGLSREEVAWRAIKSTTDLLVNAPYIRAGYAAEFAARSLVSRLVPSARALAGDFLFFGFWLIVFNPFASLFLELGGLPVYFGACGAIGLFLAVTNMDRIPNRVTGPAIRILAATPARANYSLLLAALLFLIVPIVLRLASIWEPPLLFLRMTAASPAVCLAPMWAREVLSRAAARTPKRGAV